jgi:putative DNA primase/helicase
MSAPAIVPFPTRPETDEERERRLAADAAVAPAIESIELQRGDAIELRAVRWLWRDYLACGKLHIMAGAPGVAKTTLALALAASVTMGGRWPDGTRAQPGDVLIWSGEDDPEDTLAPRLVASGAEMSRVHFVHRARDADGESRAFDPATDFSLLSATAARLPNLRLLLLDPIVNVVGAADSHKNTEVRRALQPVADFAARHGCAALGVTHFTKGTAGREPWERVTGSLAFSAAARIVLAVAKLSDDDGGGRVMVRVKSNVGPDGGGFRFDVDRVEVAAGVTAQRVLWGDPIDGAARDILGAGEQNGGDERSAFADAKSFLSALLSDGPIPTRQIKRDADDAGHAWATIRRAMIALGIEATKIGMRGPWQWQLPPKVLTNTEDAQRKPLSTFASDEQVHADDGPNEDAQQPEDAQRKPLSTFGADEQLPDDVEEF